MHRARVTGSGFLIFLLDWWEDALETLLSGEALVGFVRKSFETLPAFGLSTCFVGRAFAVLAEGPLAVQNPLRKRGASIYCVSESRLPSFVRLFISRKL